MEDNLTPKEAIISIILVFLLVISIEYGTYKFDKKNCEEKGGTYVFSLNKYETKCHFKGE